MEAFGAYMEDKPPQQKEERHMKKVEGHMKTS
jgi:hypothetical protein